MILETTLAKFRQYFLPWSLSAIVLLTIVLLVFVDPKQIQQLAFNRMAVEQGEIWRLLTGQLVHLGSNHALLNALGYFLVCVSFRSELNPLREGVLLLSSGLGVGLGVYFFSLELDWYYGLSGAIHGLLIAAALLALRTSRAVSVAFMLGGVGKVIYEQAFARPDHGMEQIIGGAVAVDSHLYGAITGLSVGLAYLMVISFKRTHQG